VAFDLTTSILEVLNFLVLVWLLKRFFYRPVLDVIEQRQRASAKIIADAEAQRHEAEALKAQYQQRLDHTERERELALAKLDQEIAGERARRLATVEAEVAADRRRRQMLEERETSERESARERQAIAVAGRFASRFLDRLAGPELEAKLLDLALDELGAENSERRVALSAALGEPDVFVRVLTAFPLEATHRALVKARLDELAGRALEPVFGEDATLKSGLCLTAGSWVLMANLRDELRFFTGEFLHDR